VRARPDSLPGVLILPTSRCRRSPTQAARTPTPRRPARCQRL